MNITKEKVEKLISQLKFKFPYSAEDWCEHLYLENYHHHTYYSNSGGGMVDSPTSVESYAKRVSELGAKCLTSGEHGNQGNYYLVYDLCKQYNLRYRHSSEVYWVKNRHEKDNKNCHMVIVAKNDEGRKDLNYILSIANIDGYYYRPRIDLELLLNVNPNNFIVTSACVAGWNYDDAEEIWLKIAKHFKNNFFLELQTHNTQKQKELNKKILRIARENDIQTIIGLDSHFIYENEHVKRDKLQEYKNIHFDDEDGWYMDYPDTKTVIYRLEEQGILSEDEILISIMNTNVFVNECEEIVYDSKFKIPNIYKNKTYEERVKIYKNELNKAYKKEKFKSKEKADGIRWEANQAIESGIVDYFLLTQKMIDLAVNKYGGIITTTSRGSSSSYITNKLLGVTTIDRFNSDVPIYPERFMTKERVLAGQCADIDNNIVDQEPFVKALRELIGEHGCYPLMAIEKLKEKNAWQLYASVNNVPPSIANKVSTYIDEYNKKLKHADDDEKEFIKIEDFIPNEYIDIYKGSLEYQGIVTNVKCHPCGFITMDGDVRKEIGLISAISETTGKRTLCACAEGAYLDPMGWVKIDLLLVDSVGLTNEFFKSIGEDVPSFDKLKEMVKGDKDTWDIYAKGITCCVNQCEQESTRKKVMKYRPTDISQLSSFIAAVRPGFASLLNTFLNREEYSTGEEKIDDLLSSTHHFAIFQESLMLVLSFLGLPMQDTYSVIKSISKKKLKGKKKDDLLQKLKTNWMKIFGNLDNFNKVWKVIEDSASYALTL